MSRGKEIDRGLKGLGNQLLGTVKREWTTRIRVRCNDCGGYRSSMFDTSPCPHPQGDDGQHFDSDVTIDVVKPKERAERYFQIERKSDKPEKRKVNPKYSEKYKTPEADDPIREPITRRSTDEDGRRQE